jgi:prolyl 4-hydroxylase
MARPRLFSAGGFDVSKGETTVTDYRITRVCFFQRQENPLVTNIEQRVASITHYPIENQEGIQYGLYDKGGYYKSHWDYCDPRWGAGSQNFLVRGGQRIITVLMYLNTLKEGDGGETVFMQHNPPLTFRPVQGTALVWYNTLFDENGNLTDVCDESTKHSAEPLLRDGVQKMIITKWVRAGTFV